MAQIYVRWIRAGRLTVEDVPERWREEVQGLIDAQPSTGQGGS